MTSTEGELSRGGRINVLLEHSGVRSQNFRLDLRK